MKIPRRVYERILTHTDRDARTGCLVSRYSTGSHGYAQVGWQDDGHRTVTLCHLAVWRFRHGPIPDGMTVDHHTCHNRKCVEETHLRLITNLDNARRNLMGRDWPLDGSCLHGHDGSWWVAKTSKNGKGYCHACRMVRQATRRGYRLRLDVSRPRAGAS